MRFISSLVTALLPILLLTLGGCGASKSLATPNCSDVVNTPAGPRARACVHEVPNGAVVASGDDGTTVVTVDGKVVATYPPCPCAVAMCTDRSGVSHPTGLPWSDGCAVCSCGELADGTLSPICTRNTCPPDASADADAAADALSDTVDASPEDGGVADAARCQSLVAAYQASYALATECTVDAGAQCATMITRPFACHCKSFVNGAADQLAAVAADWTGAGCTEICNGACPLATHADCVADSTSSTGGRCADRDVASPPPGP